MIKIVSVFALDQFSLRQQVSIGIGIILFVAVALFILSIRTITSVETDAAYLNSRVYEGTAVAEFAARVGDTHAFVTQYALSENDADLEAAQRSLGKMHDRAHGIEDAYVSAEANDRLAVDELRRLRAGLRTVR